MEQIVWIHSYSVSGLFVQLKQSWETGRQDSATLLSFLGLLRAFLIPSVSVFFLIFQGWDLEVYFSDFLKVSIKVVLGIAAWPLA